MSNSLLIIPWFQNEADFKAVHILIKSELANEPFAFKKWLEDAEVAIQDRKNKGWRTSPVIATPAAFKEWMNTNQAIPCEDSLIQYVLDLVPK